MNCKQGWRASRNEALIDNYSKHSKQGKCIDACPVCRLSEQQFHNSFITVLTLEINERMIRPNGLDLLV